MRLERTKREKRIHVTFSIPIEVNTLLHSVVEKRGLSHFVTRALENALEEEQKSLKAAYAAANKDPDRKKTIVEWSALETEGWDG